MKKIIIFISIIIASMLLSGCGNKETTKISVVSTIYPYYDFANQVGKDLIDVTMLINPGTDMHSYDPTPDDIIKITNADIFIYTGGHSDEWVNEIMDSIDESKTKVIRVMSELETLVEEEIEGATNEEEESDEIEYDEHVWTSLSNAQIIIHVIKDTLVEIDPANKNAYIDNAIGYADLISGYDSQIRELLATSTNKTLLFGDRFAFRYFTEEYDLPYSAAFPGCSSETEPSASTVTYLINKIKTEDIPAILYLEMSSQKIADTLSEETGVKTLPMHSGQTISKEDFDNKVSYTDLLNRNLETLKEVLK
jgi:zinc transport system substrate-binding protein